MKLHVIGSSSAGNGYVIENGKEAIILECGVKLKEVQKTINYDMSMIIACVVTHEHGDHSKYIKEYLTAGIDVYLSAGTKEALALTHHRLHVLQPMVKTKVYSFDIMAFDVKHDCAEPFGFLIRHSGFGTLLFSTDTYYIPYKFPGLNNILLECNYSNAILDKNLEKGLPPIVASRVLESHMELETCKAFLAANDLTNVYNIVLIHLSDGNSNAAYFKREIVDLTGKNTHIADKGMVINLSTNPF